MAKQNLQVVNIDLPKWMIQRLDRESTKLGINRKALINVLLANALIEVPRKSIPPSKKKYASYLKMIERQFAEEWDSEEDDKAFANL